MDWVGKAGRRAGKACAVVAVAATSATTAAATFTWDGDGPDETWSALATAPGPDFGRTNWVGALLRPSNGDDLVFGGTLRLDNRNDYPLLSVRRLSFAAGAGAFRLGGNGLLLQGDVTNFGNQRQTLDLALTLTGGSTWDGGSAGLAVNGAVNIGDTRLTLLRNLQVDTATQRWVVGDRAAGSLAVGGASTVSLGALDVGAVAGSMGSVTIDGAGSRLSLAESLTVGQAGTGLVTIGAGATLAIGRGDRFADTVLGDAAGSRGQLVLSGAGARLQAADPAPTGPILQLGRRGEGRLLVEAGAQAAVTSLWFGTMAGGEGIASVSGAGSLLDTEFLYLGGGSGIAGTSSGGGNGTLTVLNGARARATSMIVGLARDGRVLVTGAGSRLDVGRLLVGNGASSRGWLDVADGAVVQAGVLSMAPFLQSSAEARVAVYGTGSLLDAAVVQLGGPGNANVVLRDGGTLRSDSAAFGTEEFTLGYAQVLDGGTWRNSGAMVLGGRGGGLLAIGDGATVRTASLEVNAAGRVELAGGLLRTAGLAGSGGINWTGGALQFDGDTTLASPLRAAVTLKPGMRFDVSGTLALADGQTLTMGGGRLAAGVVSLQGGRIASADGGGLDLAEIGVLRGSGRVDAAVSGSGRTRIEATGPLVMGDPLQADGFLFDGELRAGGHRIELRSAAAARLGPKSALEGGAEIVAEGGLWLPAGARLVAQGDAAIDAVLRHEGSLGGSGGTLVMRRDVHGSGSFDSGAFAFEAGYDTGASAATVGFGRATARFGPQSVLTLKVGPTSDRLTDLEVLDFRGTLRLVFDGRETFAGGAAVDLLDFVFLNGGFDAGRIVVSGFDAGRLSFSRLNVDGTLLVSAVPAPPSAWALLSGLALLAARRRAGDRSRPLAPGRCS